MNVAITIDDVQPEALISGSEAGPASKRIVVGFGFWIFLLSDIVMFSALFASYAVLVRATAGGPTGAAAVQSSHASRSKPLVFLSRATPAGLCPCRSIRGGVSLLIWPPLLRSCSGAAFLALEIREFAT